jgi:uncharacterized membrane protein YidH (DUF202 family)
MNKNKLSPEEIKEINIRDENRYRTYISTEGVLTSWIRNTIIIFMGGITVITFSNIKEKYLLALILTLIGIIIGCISIYEFVDRKNKIERRDFGAIRIGTYNEYLSLWLIIIFMGLFFFRCVRVIKQYGLKKIFSN